MTATTPRSIAIGLTLFLLGCEREPAIVIRFDPVDLAGRDHGAPHDLGPRDAPPARDAGIARDAGAMTRAKPTAKGAAEPASTCTKDADCVVFHADCCDCANGGSQRAVAKRDEPRLSAARAKRCKDVMCTMMVSTDPTCGQRPACVEGACTLRAARPDEVKRKVPRRPAE